MGISRREWLYYACVLGAAGWVGGYYLRRPSGLPLPKLRDALIRAAESCRPVLVFVIPEDEGRAQRFGVALGAFLNQASDSTLSRLALCEIVCLPLRELGENESTFQQALGPDPILVMIGPEVYVGDRLRVSQLAARDVLPAEQTGPSLPQAAAEVVLDRMARQNEAIRAFLMEQLSDARIESLASLVSTKFPDLNLGNWVQDVVDDDPRWVAPVLAGIGGRGTEAQRTEVERIAAIYARGRYVEGRPDGSLWTRYDGCFTTTYEGVEFRQENPAFLCGIAFTTDAESRFLTFLTDDNVDRFD